MSYDLLNRFEPTPDELLRLVFGRVDESMLHEIAAADYGQDVDEHLEQLHAIKSGKVLAPMRWEPKEVLELIRWSEPEDPTWSPGSTGDRGHWMRLFSCTVLLRAAADPANEGYFTGEDSTIIQLVDSAIKLGVSTPRAALKFLCWCMQSETLGDWDRLYFAIAIQILLVVLNECDSDTTMLLIDAIRSDNTTPAEIFNDCQKKKTWRVITQKFLIESKNSTLETRQLGERFVRGADET